LVPSEYSSGSTRSQGGVTKTDNSLARRLRVEAAWHHRRRYRPGRALRKRWDAASPAARARGQARNRRLHTRWLGFDERKKRSVVANAAIAREFAGWCWSLAVLDD
jgi:transposase